MVTDLVKKKVKKVVRKEVIERRKVWKLKEDDTRASDLVRMQSWVNFGRKEVQTNIHISGRARN